MSYRPDDAKEWSDLGKLFLGGFAGLIATPSIWLAVGSPRRWLAWLGAMAWSESRYHVDAEKADETALGLLQYIDPTWEQLWPDEATRPSRLDPYAQGYTAALYVRDRVVGDYQLAWRMLMPGRFGASYFWRIWHYSPEAGYGSFSEMVAEFESAQSTAGDGTVVEAFRMWSFWTIVVVWFGMLLPAYTGFRYCLAQRGIGE